MNLKRLAAAPLLLIPLSLLAGEPGKLREISTKDLKIDFEKGSVMKPQVIATADELDKALPGAEAVKKQVDFAKDKLLLFAWAGSGGDKLAARMSDDGKNVNFSYTPGLTRDLRRHAHLYAIPKDADFKIAPGKQKIIKP